MERGWIEMSKKKMAEFDDEKALPQAYRVALYEEAEFACLFCGHRGGTATLRVVLDVPEEYGGGDERDNLLVVCNGCREQKLALGLTGLEYEDWRLGHPLLANYGPVRVQ